MATESSPPPAQAADGVANMQEDMRRLRKRLAAAHGAGRGCHLSAREMQLLGLTMLGEWWAASDDYLRSHDFGTPSQYE